MHVQKFNPCDAVLALDFTFELIFIRLHNYVICNYIMPYRFILGTSGTHVYAPLGTTLSCDDSLRVVNVILKSWDEDTILQANVSSYVALGSK